MKKNKKWMVALLVLALSVGSSLSSMAAVKSSTFSLGGEAYSFASSTYAEAYTNYAAGSCYCRLTVYGSNGSTILYQSTAPESTYASRTHRATGDTISKTISAHKITYTDGTSSGFKTLTVTP